MHNILMFLLLAMTNSYSLNLPASSVDNSKQEVNNADTGRGKTVYKKSNCAFCHGWAGDGRGHPRSPAAAANLRSSVLDKKVIAYIIRCGVVGGAMPYHDRMAYRDTRCVTDPSGLKPEFLPQKGKNINANDLEALVSYLVSGIQGRGKVTVEECEAFYKPGSRNCLYLQVKAVN